MKLATQFSSGNDGLHLHCPTGWEEMTQDQLRYTLFLLSCPTFNETEVRTLMFFRFTGVSVHKRTAEGWLCSVGKRRNRKKFFLHIWMIQSWLSVFDYVFNGKGAANRLERIGRMNAVDIDFHGVKFVEYLTIENYYQAYLTNPDTDECLEEMARIMYRKSGRGRRHLFSTAELLGTMLWYIHVKEVFRAHFPHLMKPANGITIPDMMEVMNSQIRALTDGDITKENVVLDADVWRALTELDAKAREVEELKKRK